MAMGNDDLVTAFSSLSALTRQMVIGEMERALNDTSVEYHRQTVRELQCKLATEVAALNFVLSALRQAETEFKEINGEDRSGNSTTQQGFRTSSGGADDFADRVDRSLSNDEPLPDAEGEDPHSSKLPHIFS